MSFTHKTPDQLKQEDKWFKYFNPIQAVIAVISCGIGIFAIFRLTAMFNFVVALATVIPTLALIGISMFFIIPKNRYLLGGGQYAVFILLRTLRRKKRLLVKHYKEVNDNECI